MKEQMPTIEEMLRKTDPCYMREVAKELELTAAAFRKRACELAGKDVFPQSDLRLN